MTTVTTSVDTKISIALAVLMIEESGKTKAEIAREFGVSPRSVTRYAEQYEDEALDLMNAEETPEENVELESAFNEKPSESETDMSTVADIPAEEDEVETEEPVEPKNNFLEEVERSKALAEKLNEEKVEDVKSEPKKRKEVKPASEKTEDRRGRRGRPPEGVKSIKAIVLDTLTKYKEAGELTKENRDKIIDEIVEESGHERKQAAKYFSGYKKQVGDYDES